MTTTDAVRPEVRRLLSALLTQGCEWSTEVPPDAPVPNRVWLAFLEAVEDSRLIGLLGAAYDHGWCLTDEQAGQLRHRRLRAAFAAVTLERFLVTVCERLRTAGVEHRVLKGLATAHLVYPDPSWRDTGDIDLWIAPEHFDTAVEVVAQLGTEAANDVAAAIGGRSPTRLAYTEDGRPEFDLHRHVRYGHTHVPDSLLRGAPQLFRVGAAELPAPSMEGLLVHAAIHLCAPSTALSSVADLIRLHQEPLDLPARSGEDLDAFTASAMRWVLEEVRHLVPLPRAGYESWLEARAHPVSDRVHRWIQGRPGLMPRVSQLRSLALRHAARDLRVMVHPPTTVLQARARTRRAHLTDLTTIARSSLGRHRPRIWSTVFDSYRDP